MHEDRPHVHLCAGVGVNPTIFSNFIMWRGLIFVRLNHKNIHTDSTLFRFVTFSYAIESAKQGNM